MNNIIIGTHATICSDGERPSAQYHNFKQKDWGMLFTLASDGTMKLNDETSSTLIWAEINTFSWAIFSAGMAGFQSLTLPLLAAHVWAEIYAWDQVYKSLGSPDYKNNLVIMADYEGYGSTPATTCSAAGSQPTR